MNRLVANITAYVHPVAVLVETVALCCSFVFLLRSIAEIFKITYNNIQNANQCLIVCTVPFTYCKQTGPNVRKS